MASRPLAKRLTPNQAGKVRRIMRVALDGGTQTEAARRAGMSRSAMIKMLDDLAGIPAWPPHLPTMAELLLLPVSTQPEKRKARYMTAGRIARERPSPNVAEIDGRYRADIAAAADDLTKALAA